MIIMKLQELARETVIIISIVQRLKPNSICLTP